jgi:hypothetical protein
VERAASGELAGGLGLERVQARALNNRATMSGRRILVLHALDELGSPNQNDPEFPAQVGHGAALVQGFAKRKGELYQRPFGLCRGVVSC